MLFSFSRIIFLVSLLISQSIVAAESVNDMPVKGGPYTSYSPIFTVVGHTDERPILLVSTDGGNGWVAPFITDAPESGSFESTSCTGNGPTAVCIAVGNGSFTELLPMLAVSTDGGYTWAAKSLSYRGIISGASCTGSGSTAICTVVLHEMESYQNSKPASILISQDGGNTWVKKPIEKLPISATLVSNSCTGSESDAICAAVGVDVITKHNNRQFRPLVVAGSNGGNTWVMKRVPGLLKHDVMKDVSCTGSGARATCIAIGERLVSAGQQSNKISEPLILSSTNGGQTWGMKSVPEQLKNSQVLRVNCTGNGDNTLCAVIGFTSKETYIIASTNGGQSWEKKYNGPGFLSSVSCTGNGPDAMCAAQGYLSDSHLVVITTDGGITWSEKRIENLPNESISNSISCTGAGINASCIVVGNVFIALSGDGGNSWNRSQSLVDLQLPPGRLASSAASD